MKTDVLSKETSEGRARSLRGEGNSRERDDTKAASKPSPELPVPGRSLINLVLTGLLGKSAHTGAGGAFRIQRAISTIPIATRVRESPCLQGRASSSSPFAGESSKGGRTIQTPPDGQSGPHLSSHMAPVIQPDIHAPLGAAHSHRPRWSCTSGYARPLCTQKQKALGICMANLCQDGCMDPALQQAG